MTDQRTAATDPVCSMTVEVAHARESGHVAEHDGQDYFFCGKGCVLEFGDDPMKYVDLAHRPSMEM